jgi:hypothetical protein
MQIRHLFVFTIIMAAGFCCEQFPTRYDRIESNVIRSTGFTYDPYAEGAPGDTICVRAYFPGQAVSSVSWQMSYSHIYDIYAETDTVLDVFDLPSYHLESHLPDSMDVSFTIPDSVFFLTKGISSRNLTYLKSMLPSSMQQMTQQDFAALLHDVTAIDFADTSSIAVFLSRWGATMGINPTSPTALSSLAATVGPIIKTFSIPAVIYANTVSETGKRLRVMGEFTIRCNRRFQNTLFASSVPVNHNPTLRWIGIYTVKGNKVSDFSPYNAAYTGTFSLSYFHNEIFPDSVIDTVLIDTGNSYFLAADSGIMAYHLRAADSIRGTDTLWRSVPPDSVVFDTTLDKVYYTKNGRDTFELETDLYDWLYQNIATDSVTLPVDSLLALSPGSEDGGGGEPPIIQMLPSLDTKMTHARIWVRVYDNAVGELNRPAGFAIKNIDIFFEYSVPYQQKHR